MLAKRIVKAVAPCLGVHDGKVVDIGITVQFRCFDKKELFLC